MTGLEQGGRGVAMLLGLAITLLSTGCGSDTREVDDPGVTIRGRLIDAETGATPEIHDQMVLHVFCDDLDKQVSLQPDDSGAYEVHMPGRTVRMRFADLANVYFLHEATKTLASNEATWDLRIEPTNYLLLRGTIKGLKEAREAGFNKVMFMADHDGPSLHSLHLPHKEGKFALRVSRSVIEFSVVNTSWKLSPSQIDLSGVTADEHEVVLTLAE